MKFLSLILYVVLSVLISGCGGGETSSGTELPPPAKIAYLNSPNLIEGFPNSVYDVSIDGDEIIYIADFRHNKIERFDSELNNISRLENILSPHGVTVGRDGSLYVATYSNGRILKFNPQNKKEITGWDKTLVEQKKIELPLSMVSDNRGDLYIADYGRQGLIKVNGKGKFLLNIVPNKPNTEGDFLPHGITTDGKKYLYVADRGASKTIHVFSLEGEHLTTWKSPSKDFDPLAVRLLNDRFLLVPNYTDSKIYLFDKSGNLISKLGKKGNGPSEFLSITNLALDRKGYGYAVEEKGNRIQKIDFNAIIKAYKN